MSDTERVVSKLDRGLELLPEHALHPIGENIHAAINIVEDVTGGEPGRLGEVMLSMYSAAGALLLAQQHLQAGTEKIQAYRDGLLADCLAGHDTTDPPRERPPLASRPQPARNNPNIPKGVKYDRPMPTRWQELETLTRDLLRGANTGNGPVIRTKEMCDALLTRLRALDDETLDEHRYYGIGLIMCGLAQGLANGGIRRRAVADAGRSLFRMWRTAGSADRESLRPNDILGAQIGGYLSQVMRSTAQLSPEAQLLNDALHVQALERQDKVKHPEKVGYSSILLGQSLENGIIKDGVAMQFVAAQPGGAASSVIRTILRKQEAYIKRQRRKAKLPSGDPMTAVEILDTVQPEKLQLVNMATRAAALRLDEFPQIDSLFEVDSNGQTIFRRDHMVPTAKLQPPAIESTPRPVLHRRRLRCPSMYVGAATEHPTEERAEGAGQLPHFEELIPVVVDFIVSAVRNADQIAKKWSGDRM